MQAYVCIYRNICPEIQDSKKRNTVSDSFKANKPVLGSKVFRKRQESGAKYSQEWLFEKSEIICGKENNISERQ